MAFYIAEKGKKRLDWIWSQALLLKTALRRSRRTEACIFDQAPESRISSSKHYVIYVVRVRRWCKGELYFIHDNPKEGERRKARKAAKKGNWSKQAKLWKKRTWGKEKPLPPVICSPPQGCISRRACSSPSTREPVNTCVFRQKWSGKNHGQTMGFAISFAKLIPLILTFEDFILNTKIYLRYITVRTTHLLVFQKGNCSVEWEVYEGSHSKDKAKC